MGTIMKKLFFILLICISSLANAQLYIDDPCTNQPIGYHTYPSNSDGHAGMCYQMYVTDFYLVVEGYSARFKYPDGNWTGWIPGQSGGHYFTQAGTYYIQGHVYVDWDINGGNHYDMYTNAIPFYVSDNIPPAIPQNLSIGGNPGNNLVKLTWTANSEADLSNYEIFREVQEYGTGWLSIGTTTNNYFVDQEMYYAPGAGDFHSYYKVRAMDINNNYSNYSSVVSSQTEFNGKQSGGSKSTFSISDEIYDYKLNNYPNPFNPLTNITYSIKEAGFVQLKIYNMLGKEIAALINEAKSPGQYSVCFDGAQLPSGIYVCVMKTNNVVKSQKLILMK